MENNSGQNNQQQDNNNTDINRNFGAVDSQHNVPQSLHHSSNGHSRQLAGNSDDVTSAIPNNFRLSGRQVEVSCYPL
jgi:hypothetical protein